MNKVSELLNKHFIYALWVFCALSLIVNIRSCGVQKEVRKVKQESIVLSNALDSLNDNTYSKEELDIRMEIEGYEISKRMLYDQNAIVRTTVRPDDRMNEYDQKIEELRTAFAQEPDLEKQKAIARKVQERAFEVVTYVPLGTVYQPVAYRSDHLEGVVKSPVSIFWNAVKK